MTRKRPPKVSIIVINWNGKEHLKYCLPAFGKVDYPRYEVIVVDNASTDGSVEFLKGPSFAKDGPYQKIKLILSRKNLGYAGGANLGIKNSDGDYVLITNNDIKVTAGFLTPLIELMEKDESIGCLAPKLLCLKNKKMIDQMGSFFTDTGFLYHYGYLQDASLPIYNQQLKIFSVKGACFLLRKKAIDKIGGFDDDYFLFFEETDLCHRLWLAGYQVIYEPKSIVYHHGAGVTWKLYDDSSRFYFAFRNRIDSYIKNLELLNLVKILLTLGIFYFGLFVFYLAIFKPIRAWVLLKAVIWNLAHLPQVLKKRALVQKQRRVKDAQIFQQVRRNPPLKYYYYLFTDLRNYRYEEITQ